MDATDYTIMLWMLADFPAKVNAVCFLIILAMLITKLITTEIDREIWLKDIFWEQML